MLALVVNGGYYAMLQLLLELSAEDSGWCQIKNLTVNRNQKLLLLDVAISNGGADAPEVW
jgi:hypothetical protein